MSETPEQINFCCAVAQAKSMKLRDKVHWLHICADEYWEKFEVEQKRASRLAEAVALLNLDGAVR